MKLLLSKSRRRPPVTAGAALRQLEACRERLREAEGRVRALTVALSFERQNALQDADAERSANGHTSVWRRADTRAKRIDLALTRAHRRPIDHDEILAMPQELFDDRR